MPSSQRGTPAPPGGGPGPGSEEFDEPSNPTQGDGRNWKADIRAHDRKMNAAYESGRSGMPADPDFSDDEVAAHSSGAEEAAQPAASAPTGGTSAPAGSSPLPLGTLPNQVASAVGGQASKVKAQGAPIILGMVGYCLAVNWFRYGWPGVTGWFTAKFENTVSPAFPSAAVTKQQNTAIPPAGPVKLPGMTPAQQAAINATVAGASS